MKKEKILAREHHKNRPDLAGEHVFGDLGQLILLIIFLAVWIADSFFLHYSTYFSGLIPLYLKIALGVIIFIISGYLAQSGLRVVFGEVREEPIVIRDGVFGWMRHPIYLGAILFYVGLLIFSLSGLALLIWLIIIAFYHWLARHEERLLLEKFGVDYQKYVQEVPMWIPWIRRSTGSFDKKVVT